MRYAKLMDTRGKYAMTTDTPNSSPAYAIEAHKLSFFYARFRAVKEVELQIPPHQVTAIIGPSGCGKSTVLRCFNRMNDLIPSAHVMGEILFHGKNIYDPDVDPVLIRHKIGMVFQRPNPFPKSIFENIAWGAHINGYTGKMDELVQQSLEKAAIWDEVKDHLKENALSLSGGQQQRLCIARALAVEPEIILMDEPCSALDPVATLKIEELMNDLKEQVTIVIVTHNMQQAARVSDFTAMMMIDDDHAGQVIEYNKTQIIFTRPHEKRTEEYVTGRFG